MSKKSKKLEKPSRLKTFLIIGLVLNFLAICVCLAMIYNAAYFGHLGNQTNESIRSLTISWGIFFAIVFGIFLVIERYLYKKKLGWLALLLTIPGALIALLGSLLFAMMYLGNLETYFTSEKTFVCSPHSHIELLPHGHSPVWVESEEGGEYVEREEIPIRFFERRGLNVDYYDAGYIEIFPNGSRALSMYYSLNETFFSGCKNANGKMFFDEFSDLKG